jgi:hypothetical protein
MPRAMSLDSLDAPILSHVSSSGVILCEYQKRKLHRKDDKERVINMYRAHRRIRDAKSGINQ